MAGKRIGVVIGNNYPNSDKELKHAVADATKMKEILENKDICYFDKVVLLNNKTSREAAAELEKLFKNIHQNDLIFIYFSGHGKKDFTNNLYLLFEDTNEELLLATSLPFEYINKCREFPGALKSSVVIVLDCCYSAAAGMKDTDMGETLENCCSTGTVILTSTGSTGSPTALENEKLGHSIFTNYLIEGLEKGYADEKGDGYISIDGLYNYASEKTKENSSQSPMKKGNVEGTIIIGKNIQKIRKQDYELKIKKLLDEFGSQFPINILGECQAILRKHYQTPSLINKDDKIILGYLEHLLEDDLSPEKRVDIIQNCIEVVQKLKRINGLSSQDTITKLTSSASQYTSGEPILLTAKVSSMSYGIEKPSGTVTFLEGSTKIGTETVNSGQAILTTSSLSVGSHSIMAQYNGDDNYEPSTSSILILTVLVLSPIKPHIKIGKVSYNSRKEVITFYIAYLYNLAHFGYQKSTKEAIGFYMVYLLLLIILAPLLALIPDSIMNYHISVFALTVGNIIAIVFSLGVSFLILKEKNQLGNSSFILLALLSGLMALILSGVNLSGVGGLIPAAYLTTKPIKTK